MPNVAPHLGIMKKKGTTMRKDKEGLKFIIKRFFQLMEEFEDHPGSTFTFVSFIRNFLRHNSSDVLPTIEIMTIIRELKPNVFSSMKQMAKQDPILEFLTGLSMDLQVAEEKLHSILEAR
ncbi:hypothetical protein [Mesobacillus zeae]|nr:hypothetical protein [Mesobacillus zeae]